MNEWGPHVLPLIAIGGVVFQAGVSYATLRYIERQRADDLLHIEKRLDKLEDRVFNGGDR